MFEDNIPAIVRVFDNGTQLIDRFTVVIFHDGEMNIYSMGLDADRPGGFNEWVTEDMRGIALDALNGDTSIVGKEVSLIDLPQTVQRGIAYRFQHAY